MTGALAALAGAGGGINVKNTYASGSSGNETIPKGASLVVIELWGGGGGGGRGSNLCVGNDGGGGGSGAYVKKTIPLSSASWGKTIAYLVGIGGSVGAGPGTYGGNGQASTVSSGTFTLSTLTAGGGGGASGGNLGPVEGAGGTASGGDVNTSGNTNSTSNYKGPGAPNGGGDQTTPGTTGTVPGGGGAGTHASGTTAAGNAPNGGPGGGGLIVFTYR